MSRQLINLAKLEAEDFPLKIEAVDIYAEIEMHRAASPMRWKRMWNSLDGSEDAVVTTDRHALIAIFTNLLDNALQVRAARQPHRSPYPFAGTARLLYYVARQRPRVSEEHLPRLFERFTACPARSRPAADWDCHRPEPGRQDRRAAARVTEGLDDRHRFRYRFAGKLPATD
ncbi:hypothetical protein M8494_26295 [Serratia ureilytica]